MPPAFSRLLLRVRVACYACHATQRAQLQARRMARSSCHGFALQTHCTFVGCHISCITPALPLHRQGGPAPGPQRRRAHGLVARPQPRGRGHGKGAAVAAPPCGCGCRCLCVGVWLGVGVDGRLGVCALASSLPLKASAGGGTSMQMFKTLVHMPNSPPWQVDVMEMKGGDKAMAFVCQVRQACRGGGEEQVCSTLHVLPPPSRLGGGWRAQSASRSLMHPDARAAHSDRRTSLARRPPPTPPRWPRCSRSLASARCSPCPSSWAAAAPACEQSVSERSRHPCHVDFECTCTLA